MSFLKNVFGRKGEPMPSEPIFPGESFTIFKLDFPDGWGLASANKAYDNYPNKSFYGWHVLIELEVIDKNENGHPIDSEAAKLNAIEDKVDAFLKKNQTAHFVARVTRNGFRDLLYYIDKPAINQQQLAFFCDEVMKERAINLTIQKDPEWKAVGFIK
jgi:Family of unknown function (DUF695)